jgi:hypothetical protein
MEASTKSFEMKEPSANNLPTQIKDVICNPRNPVNPDSKPQVKADEYYNETCRDG